LQVAHVFFLDSQQARALPQKAVDFAVVSSFFCGSSEVFSLADLLLGAICEEWMV
jgi:hypothetical protein